MDDIIKTCNECMKAADNDIQKKDRQVANNIVINISPAPQGLRRWIGYDYIRFI